MDYTISINTFLKKSESCKIRTIPIFKVQYKKLTELLKFYSIILLLHNYVTKKEIKEIKSEVRIWIF